MPGDVRERLLRRPQERDLDVRMEGDDLAGDPDVDRDPVEVRPLARDPSSASGSDRDSSAAGIDASTERRASVRLSRASSSAFARWRSRSAGRSIAWLAASSWVMIPVRPCAIVSWISRGHPLPLVEDARLARLGEQLGVEAGVLLERRLEPGERLAAFLALLGHLLAEDRAAR